MLLYLTYTLITCEPHLANLCYSCNAALGKPLKTSFHGRSVYAGQPTSCRTSWKVRRRRPHVAIRLLLQTRKFLCVGNSCALVALASLIFRKKIHANIGIGEVPYDKTSSEDAVFRPLSWISVNRASKWMAAQAYMILIQLSTGSTGAESLADQDLVSSTGTSVFNFEALSRLLLFRAVQTQRNYSQT